MPFAVIKEAASEVLEKVFKRSPVSGPALKIVKWAVLFGSFYYIYIKLFQELGARDFVGRMKEAWGSYGEHGGLMFLIFLLMPFNWLVESWRWKEALAGLQPMKFSRAVRAVLTGLFINLLAPMRLGDFGGRALFLYKGRRMKGVFLTWVAGFSQFSVSFLAGALSIGMALQWGMGKGWPGLEWLAQVIFVLLPFWFLAYSTVGVWLPMMVSLFKVELLNHWVESVKTLKFKKLWKLFGISFLKQSIFSTQYLILLQIFGVPGLIWHHLILISIVFVLQSLVPGFILAQIGVRGAVTLFVFGTFSHLNTYDLLGVFCASISLWFINVIIPALVGIPFFMRWTPGFMEEQVS